MKFFIDSICLDSIKKAHETGLIAGITTNPSLLAPAKEKGHYMETLRSIADLHIGPFSIEVTHDDKESMLQQAKEFLLISPDVVIKVPLTPEGLKVCYILSQEGIPVNVTLCFSAAQALLAARAQATYISPFIGRLDDSGGSGAKLLQDIRSLYDTYGFSTKILAASIRHPRHVYESFQARADIITLAPSIFFSLYDHPLTTKGLSIFHKDWSHHGDLE